MKPGDRYFWHNQTFVREVEIMEPQGRLNLGKMQMVDIKVISESQPRQEVAFISDLHKSELEALKAARTWAEDRVRILNIHLKQAA